MFAEGEDGAGVDGVGLIGFVGGECGAGVGDDVSGDRGNCRAGRGEARTGDGVIDEEADDARAGVMELVPLEPVPFAASVAGGNTGDI